MSHTNNLPRRIVVKAKLLILSLFIFSTPLWAEWSYWPAYDSTFDAELRGVSAHFSQFSCSIQFDYDLSNRHWNRATYVSALDLTFSRVHSVHHFTNTHLYPGASGRYYAYTIYDCDLAQALLDRHTTLIWGRISTSSAPME